MTDSIIPEPCDLLIEAGHVVPVEPHGVVLDDHAVAVRDGVIVAVLPTAEARARFLVRSGRHDEALAGERPHNPGLVAGILLRVLGNLVLVEVAPLFFG
jgi:hypothetical protein